MAGTNGTQEISRPQRVIKPSKGWSSLRLGELWEYRELLYFLTWRDVKVRYKQAVLGIAWAVLQPVVTMVVFTIVFQKLMKVPYTAPVVDGVAIPYPIFTYAGLLPWSLFSGALGRAGTSLVGNANLLTKVYFPRLVIPVSAVIAGLVDFLIAFAVFIVLMLAYQLPFTWSMLLLPLFVLLAMATALACGLWLSALNVLYRDVGYIIPFLVQLWMFLSPVMYQPPTDLSPVWTLIYGLNPMAGVIAGFRWALIGSEPPDKLIGVAVVMVLLLMASGLAYFKRMERTFADVV
jgi:lipopolysaccharide transport system permease protein